MFVVSVNFNVTMFVYHPKQIETSPPNGMYPGAHRFGVVSLQAGQ